MEDDIHERGLEIRQLIANQFWHQLVRRLTYDNARCALFDSKMKGDPVIFLPHSSDPPDEQLDYYKQSDLKTVILAHPKNFDDEFVYRISSTPGLLALKFSDHEPQRYVVPGGRFNEFYGWDSYFIALGLIQDAQLDLASDIADQFCFEIANYGKILNANRPYYLGRTQPPFLTDLAWKLHDKKLQNLWNTNTECVAKIRREFVGWIKAAIKEYETVWASEPRYDKGTNLFKYYAQGRGIPPEVESGGFDQVLEPYVQKHGLTITEFISQYNSRLIDEPELDTYLKHDRSLRESGHDVSTRFVNCCADLVSIDLASLLYKYETDIFRAISLYPAEFPEQTAAKWRNRSQETREAANKYLWNEKYGVFCDFNVRTKRQHLFTENSDLLITATTLWSLWSGLASPEQALKLRTNALHSLEFDGGLAATSRIPDEGRQWDWPAGWAPHQLLAWTGLELYGFKEDASRLANKWLHTVVRAASLTDGSLFEKYDVTGVEHPHDVRAEYGNQGSNTTGFGWTNAAFAIGWDRYKMPKFEALLNK